MCMCTVVTYRTRDHYFGRNLDLERTYGERVVITPRQYPLGFRKTTELKRHYAMIGMAAVADGYPLYFDATNEIGLSMAGLSFPENADFGSEMVGKENVAPFELIPWLLGQCGDLSDVRRLLDRVNVVKLNFSETLPLTPLHWMISDRSGSVVLECVREGMRLYDNPVGVLTNEPPFDVQMFFLNNFMRLSTEPPVNSFSSELELKRYSAGMGAMGLPGDLSSMSRFVRAAFARLNASCGESEIESVSQFFHILGFVSQMRGLTRLEDGACEITQYSSCCNTDRGIYYYTTYENSCISAVNMHREPLDGRELIIHPLVRQMQIYRQN